MTGSNDTAEMAALLRELDEFLPEIPSVVEWAEPNDNRLELPDPSLRRLHDLRNPTIPADLLDFYQVSGGITLPDVETGVFVHSPKVVLRELERGAPVRVNAPREMEVVPFGSDGGGGLFALDRADGSVWYLPPGLVESGSYSTDSSEFRQVSTNLISFLRDILRTVAAFVEA